MGSDSAKNGPIIRGIVGEYSPDFLLYGPFFDVNSTRYRKISTLPFCLFPTRYRLKVFDDDTTYELPENINFRRHRHAACHSSPFIGRYI